MIKNKLQETLDKSFGISDQPKTQTNNNIQDIINKNTGAPSRRPEPLGPDNAIWDDGEWISWDLINHQLHEQDLKQEFPEAETEIVQVFEDLVNAAIEYKELTGRYLQIWGELGELFAEIKYGVRRHRPGTAGSDGRIGNDWIEIKTISPEKGNKKIQVKRAGNFNKLLVVKINDRFEFESKLIDRKKLKKSSGKHASISWNTVKE